MVDASKFSPALEQQPQRNDKGNSDESKEHWADGGLGKGMHRGQDTGPGEEGPEEHQRIGQDDQQHVPMLQHALLLLDHHGVQEGSAREPWHEGCDLNRIPAPVAAPSQNVVGPSSPKDQSQSQEEPRHQGPAASNPDPAIVASSGDQRRHGESIGDHEGHETQVQHRRMNDHSRVPKKRIQTLAVGRCRGVRTFGSKKCGCLHALRGDPDTGEWILEDDD